MAFASYIMGDFEGALALREKLIRKSDEGFVLHWHERALQVGVTVLSILGRWPEALQEGQRALSIAQQYGDRHNISQTAVHMSWAYLRKGDLNQAIKYGEMAVENAPTPFDRALGRACLAQAWCRMGELRKGIDILEEVVTIFRAGQYAPIEIYSGIELAQGYSLIGEQEKARKIAEYCIESAERCGARYFVALAYRLLGELALKTKHQEAAPHLEQAISIFAEIKAENDLGLAFSSMGRLHKLRGEYAEARRYLTQALEIFERLGTLIEPDKVRKELAELPA